MSRAYNLQEMEARKATPLSSLLMVLSPASFSLGCMPSLCSIHQLRSVYFIILLMTLIFLTHWDLTKEAPCREGSFFVFH